MGLYFESFLYALIFALILFVVAVRLYYAYSFNFWKRKGIPFVEPSFPFGNIKQLMTQQEGMGESSKRIYFQLKEKGAKYGGFYWFFTPMFMPLDPDIVKQIMIKDFNHFQDRGFYSNEKDDPLSAHLFFLGGPKWKTLRNKLSPTFTSGKIRGMFQTLVSCGKRLEDTLEEIIRKAEPIDIKDVGARYTTDVISFVAFGLETSSLRDPNNEFRKYGKKIFLRSFFDKLRTFFLQVLPNVGRFFKMKVTDEDISEFFMDIIRQTVEYREKNNIERNDMLQLAIKLKNNQSLDDSGLNLKPGESITFEELAAHCFVFFIAGYETSSTTMTFALFELCQHQDIQDKLREEIRTVLARHNGELTYEAIMEMTYMEKVVNETLRKYPPLPFLLRECRIDWQIPGTDIVIPKGTRVQISNYGLHMDPEYFPQPDKFDPERFSEEKKSKRPPCTHIPFGDGPRNCIGMRFGFLQTKVGLTYFLKNHRFKLDPKTILPIDYDKNGLILSHKHGIWLQSERV